MNLEKIVQVIAQVVAGLFIPLVLQYLWNWFAVPALTLNEMLYWQMFGIFLFVRVLLFKADDPRIDHNWQKTLTVLALIQSSLPMKHQEIAKDKIKEINDNSWQLWVNKPFTEVLLGVCALALGWIVHVFLIHGK